MDIVSPTGPLAQLFCFKFGRTGELIKGIWDKKWTSP
jgi:hypothetical protein